MKRDDLIKKAIYCSGTPMEQREFIADLVISEVNKFKKEMRNAMADYMRSEGCSCCQDYEGHIKHKSRIGKMLNVPKYPDKSGYNFGKFATKKGPSNV